MVSPPGPPLTCRETGAGRNGANGGVVVTRREADKGVIQHGLHGGEEGSRGGRSGTTGVPRMRVCGSPSYSSAASIQDCKIASRVSRGEKENHRHPSSSVRRHAMLVPMLLLLPHAVPGEVASGRQQRPDSVPRNEPAALLRQQARVTRLEPRAAVRVLRLVARLPRELSKKKKRRVVGQRQKLQQTKSALRVSSVYIFVPCNST
jgi:hypothetical protein